MPRRPKRSPKRDTRPLFRWRARRKLTVQDCPRIEGRRPEIEIVEGPPTILELGFERGALGAERAALLAEHMRAIAYRLSDPEIDPRERHELVDQVDDAWWGLARCTLSAQTRLAMRFVEAVEAGSRERVRGRAARAVARELVSRNLLDDADREALNIAPRNVVAALRRVARSDADASFRWAMYAETESIDRARSIFAATHPRLAVDISKDDWLGALEAFERGPRSRRGPRSAEGPRKNNTKWAVLARILVSAGLLQSSDPATAAEHLRDQWKFWKREGTRAPLFIVRRERDAANHEGSKQPPEHRRHAPAP